MTTLLHSCRAPVPQVSQAAGYDPTNMEMTPLPTVANCWESSTPYQD
jgi:hypothetical protein